MSWRSPETKSRLLPAAFIEPCLPTEAARVPDGTTWIHEVKHDGYRLIVRRDGDRVRLFTRRGYDWSTTLDGEAVVCGDNGVADFDNLHSQAHNDSVFLYAFDLLELNGDDLRNEPLEVRKSTLQSLLRKAKPGVRYNEHLNGDGATIFNHACRLGLEGFVSKRRDFPYRSGRCKSWVKVKNPASPARMRIAEGTW
jgi:bifunctional non-homologous end joining protein LigD